MRTHEGNRPDENFQFYRDQDTLKLMAKMTDVRAMMKDYIVVLYEEAHQLGYPVQRPLFLHYEEDAYAYDLQYQYLFGPDVLVCPVVDARQVRKEVYLPKDEWVHLWTGDVYIGANTVEVGCPVGYPPVFYKKSSKYSKLFQSITQKYQMKKEDA
jgi:alpha-glucosidase